MNVTPPPSITRQYPDWVYNTPQIRLLQQMRLPVLQFAQLTPIHAQQRRLFIQIIQGHSSTFRQIVPYLYQVCTVPEWIDPQYRLILDEAIQDLIAQTQQQLTAAIARWNRIPMTAAMLASPSSVLSTPSFASTISGQ